MSIAYANRLLGYITSQKNWPPPYEAQIARWLTPFIGFRESVADVLIPDWWGDEEEETKKRGYIIDPLGERIPTVWADMLYGEEPEFRAANKTDQDRMDELVDFNRLPSEIHRAEETCSSEGEVWWRIVSMPSRNHAMIEWHSRLNVIPLWIGNQCVAAAFLSVLEDEEEVEKRANGPDKKTQKEWLYVEVHADGVVLNRLFHHKKDGPLGDPVPLNERVETADLRDSWAHGLPMLAGRVPNKLGRDYKLGISDYRGIDGLLQGLSDIQNIGQNNAHLTGKQRVVVPQRFLDQGGKLPRGAEVIIATEVDADPDKIKNEFAQIEWKFDAAALIQWKDDLVDTILTRARIAPQLVGRHTENAQTGPALRARLLDSLLAAQGKSKPWLEDMPRVLSLAAQVEKLGRGNLGSGVAWGQVEKKDRFANFKLRSALPEDEESRSRRIVTEVNAHVLSRETAIQTNNPTWTPERVDEEIEKIESDLDSQVERQRERNPEAFEKDGPQDSQTGKPAVDPASRTGRRPGEPKPSTTVDPSKVRR